MSQVPLARRYSTSHIRIRIGSPCSGANAIGRTTSTGTKTAVTLNICSLARCYFVLLLNYTMRHMTTFEVYKLMRSRFA